MNNVPLINKYRPADFDEMIGHVAIRASLQRALASDSRPQSFLFTGPGGIGKTTSARIVAKHLGCELIEMSAAEHSGADDMREVIELGNHMSLSGSGRRAILIDECHGLSKSAWQVLLKILEEPPPYLCLMLCTTELAKVPDTVIQRCFHVALKPLSVREIEELLLTIIELEGLTVHNDVLTAVIEASRGSARSAITILQAVWDAPSREEAARIITLHDMSEPIIELCKHLTSDGMPSWAHVQKLLLRIDDSEWDGALILIGRFIAGAMMKQTDLYKAKRLWAMLDALTFPVETFDNKIKFYAALGKIVFSEIPVG